MPDWEAVAADCAEERRQLRAENAILRFMGDRLAAVVEKKELFSWEMDALTAWRAGSSHD